MTKRKTSCGHNYGIIVIGASAGGVKALSTLIDGLPGSLAAAVFIVQHLEENSKKSRLSDILARHTPLPVVQAQDQMPVKPGTFYVAQPGTHLRLTKQMIHLDNGALVRFVRPSADVLFMSAAENYGNRVIGVILTGTGSDGAMGCRAIKENGGRCIAQDKQTAQFFDMPEAAIATGAVTHVLPLDKIPGKIADLLNEQAEDTHME